MFDQQQKNHWGGNHLNTSKFNGMSPTGAYSYVSHNAAPTSPSTLGTSMHSASIPNQQVLAPPCQSSPNVNMGSPPSQARPGSQVNITAQNNVSPIWGSGNTSDIYTSPISNSSNPQNGGFYNSLVQENRNFGTNLDEKDPLSMSPTASAEQPRTTMQSHEKPFEIGKRLEPIFI